MTTGPTTQEPWSGCFECGHPAHPFSGNRDVRCGTPTNNGNPADGPEPCECVQWPDVLAAYRAIEAEARDTTGLREALDATALVPEDAPRLGTAAAEWYDRGWTDRGDALRAALAAPRGGNEMTEPTETLPVRCGDCGAVIVPVNGWTHKYVINDHIPVLAAIEAEARDTTGLREALTDTRTILSAHILRLARYHRLDRGHLGTFTREAIALIDAALAATPPEPRIACCPHCGEELSTAPPESRWPSRDELSAAIHASHFAGRQLTMSDLEYDDRLADSILAALREGGERP